MYLKQLPKLFFNDKQIQQFQDYVGTWVNGFIDNFRNIIPNRVVVSDSENNLKSSDVTDEELSFLSGATSSIQNQINDLNTEVTNLSSTKLDKPVWQTYTPTITLSGAGTIPTYTTTFSGRYLVVNKIVFVEIFCENNSGGTAGSGVGIIQIDLPPSYPAGTNQFSFHTPKGVAVNGSDEYILTGFISPSSTFIGLSYFSAINSLTQYTAADQNQAVRSLRLQFFYEID